MPQRRVPPGSPSGGRFAPTPQSPPNSSPRAPQLITTSEEHASPSIEAAAQAWSTRRGAQGEPEYRSTATLHPYHLAYQDIHDGVVLATDGLFTKRPSRLNREEVHAAFTDWMDTASNIYSVPTPELKWHESARGVGGGFYTPHTVTITLSHTSITTFLHEYRHHLQSQRLPQIVPDLEDDARAWSLSLYHLVRPKLLRKMAEQGRILHLSARDF